MLGIIKTRLQTTTWQSRELETRSGKGIGKIVIANYATSNHVLKSRRVPTAVVGNLRLSGVGSVLNTPEWLDKPK